MKGYVGAALALAASLGLAGVAAAQSDTPETFNDALEQGFEIVAVIGQGDDNEDHVIYMEKGNVVIVCGFRLVLTDDGFDERQSHTLGVCTGFK